MTTPTPRTVHQKRIDECQQDEMEAMAEQFALELDKAQRDLAARDAELAAARLFIAEVGHKLLDKCYADDDNRDGLATDCRHFATGEVCAKYLDVAWQTGRAIAAEQRAEAAERSLARVNEDRHELLRELAEWKRKAEEAASELQMRRTPLNAPGDEELIRQSGIQLRHCSCSGGSGDEAHADDCPLWLDVLAARQWWRDRHVVAWSCSQEAKGGKMCAQWCGHQKYCTAHTRDDIEIAAIAAKGEAK